MTDTSGDPEHEVSLPAERSFVVQFRAGPAVRRDGPWAGRIEHVVSGRAARFDSRAAMCEFIAVVLAPQRPADGPAAGDDPRWP